MYFSVFILAMAVPSYHDTVSPEYVFKQQSPLVQYSSLLSIMPSVISYLDQIFREPKFLVCNEGFCDFEFVASTILEYASPRCQHLLAPMRAETASILSAIPGTTHIPLETRKPMSKPAAELVAATGGVSAVIELISDVWNGSEPINYVRHFPSV
jgi:hypothetical protein